MSCEQHALLKGGEVPVNCIYIFAVDEEMWSQKIYGYTQNSGVGTHSCNGRVYCSSGGFVTGECWKSALTCSVSLTFWFEMHFTEYYEYTKKSDYLNG